LWKTRILAISCQAIQSRHRTRFLVWRTSLAIPICISALAKKSAEGPQQACPVQAKDKVQGKGIGGQFT
jgi:hypothetical protein